MNLHDSRKPLRSCEFPSLHRQIGVYASERFRHIGLQKDMVDVCRETVSMNSKTFGGPVDATLYKDAVAKGLQDTIDDLSEAGYELLAHAGRLSERLETMKRTLSVSVKEKEGPIPGQSKGEEQMAQKRTKSRDVKLEGMKMDPKTKKRRALEAEAEANGTATLENDAAAEAKVDDAVAVKPKKEKREPKNDDVQKLLSECEDNVQVLRAAKGYAHIKHVNKDAFERLTKEKDKLQGGLFRMRMGNLLRGSKSAAKKAK